MTQTSLDEFGGDGAGDDAPEDGSDGTVDGGTAGAGAGERDSAGDEAGADIGRDSSEESVGGAMSGEADGDNHAESVPEAEVGEGRAGGEIKKGTGDDSERRDSASGGVDTVGPPTSRWHANGAVCAVCGEQTARCWRDDGRLVCPNCKNWG